jgi:transposase
MFAAVRVDADLQEGVIDSTIVRAHACAAGAKNHAEAESLGCSQRGFSCKIHALTDALGYPLRFILIQGQASDMGQAEALVTSIPLKRLMADKGYDSKTFVEYLDTLIPSKSNALEPRKCDWVAYKERHLIECFFGKMKHCRCVFSRFEKKEQNFLGFLVLVAVLIWTR